MIAEGRQISWLVIDSVAPTVLDLSDRGRRDFFSSLLAQAVKTPPIFSPSTRKGEEMLIHY